jgi:aspartyl aminopeptidase
MDSSIKDLLNFLTGSRSSFLASLEIEKRLKAEGFSYPA